MPEAITKQKTTHNRSKTTEYHRWSSMIQRCINPRKHNWMSYGGRGITVCERWRHSFENFFEDMGKAPPGMTLERVNNDGHYEPGNVRWATPKEQRANQRPYVPFKRKS